MMGVTNMNLRMDRIENMNLVFKNVYVYVQELTSRGRSWQTM